MPRTNVNSAPVEAGHGNVESLALHPDDVLHGNLAILKKRGSLSPFQITRSACRSIANAFKKKRKKTNIPGFLHYSYACGTFCHNNRYLRMMQ
jgi:hypothetical protein